MKRILATAALVRDPETCLEKAEEPAPKGQRRLARGAAPGSGASQLSPPRRGGGTVQSISYVFALVLLLALVGCHRSPSLPAAPATATSAGSPGIRFRDVAGASGIDFSLGHGGRSPLTILETAGGGAAFADFNGDGRLDVLLVGPYRVGLFHNRGASGDGARFVDVTARSGLQQHACWMGCAAGDYDGDGRVDILLTGYRRTALYRNLGALPDGQPRFRDVTREAGFDLPGWSLSGAFADFDRDGRLDLYVTRYLKFGPHTPQLCRLGNIRSACGPEVYDPEFGVLYRNIGGGRFQDFTAKAGVGRCHGKSWSALFSDLEGDGYPALYLANDMVPCDFFLNHAGRFSDSGQHAGVAYDAAGHLQGAMGCDSGDYDNDGRLDLLVTTFFAQSTSLYHNDGDGFFREVGSPAGLGAPTMRYVGFGAAFLDADNDGWQDVFLANGHVRDDIRQYDPMEDYAQPLQMFRNQRGWFTEVSRSAGEPFSRPIVGRGVAVGDYDQDGRTDVLVCNLEGKAELLRNLSDAGNHWISVRLRGSNGNTQALGARVTVEAAGQRQLREVRTCGSVMSAHEPVAHFGLGGHAVVDRLVVRWPDGKETTRLNVRADQAVVLEER